jgi:hypothetical protein
MVAVRAPDTLVMHLRRVGRDLGRAPIVRRRSPTLDHVTAAAVAAVPGAEVARLTLVGHRVPDPDVVDELQTDDGPAAALLADPPADGIVVAADLAGDDHHRWPGFAEHVLDAGYRSTVSVLLEVASTPRGALNLYARPPRAFDDTACRTAGLLAVVVGTLLLAAEQAAPPEQVVPVHRALVGEPCL